MPGPRRIEVGTRHWWPKFLKYRNASTTRGVDSDRDRERVDPRGISERPGAGLVPAFFGQPVLLLLHVSLFLEQPPLIMPMPCQV